MIALQNGQKPRHVARFVHNPPDLWPCVISLPGNLPFTAKQADLEKHFRTCAGLLSVRLLTKKGTNKPRGCAFVEFDNRPGHSKALLLHHSTLGGRKINVEATVGGGGKGSNRQEKIKQKNEAIGAWRKEAVTNLKSKRAKAAAASAAAGKKGKGKKPA
eukprot:m.77538 g.77538  ORF g.77538 m.77538 type:complete len:159 (-) comp14550_c0_seq4:24-500(-)